MEKHTPGPWHVRPNPGPNVVSEHGDDPATIGDDKGRFIAAVKRQGPATDANARLIAAAPELLKALEDILAAFSVSAMLGEGCDPIQNAAAAVRKATEE